MKNFAYKFWKAVVTVLSVIQWTLPVMIIPGLFVSLFMQEAGWDAWWAPAFLGKDGAEIIWCFMVLEATFITWILKRYLDIHVVTPLWLGTPECKKLCKRITRV